MKNNLTIDQKFISQLKERRKSLIAQLWCPGTGTSLPEHEGGQQTIYCRRNGPANVLYIFKLSETNKKKPLISKKKK